MNIGLVFAALVTAVVVALVLAGLVSLFQLYRTTRNVRDAQRAALRSSSPFPIDPRSTVPYAGHGDAQQPRLHSYPLPKFEAAMRRRGYSRQQAASYVAPSPNVDAEDGGFAASLAMSAATGVPVAPNMSGALLGAALHVDHAPVVDECPRYSEPEPTFDASASYDSSPSYDSGSSGSDSSSSCSFD